MHTWNRTAPTVALSKRAQGESVDYMKFKCRPQAALSLITLQQEQQQRMGHTSNRTPPTVALANRERERERAALRERTCGPHEVQVQTTGGRRRCHWARCSNNNWLRELLRVRIPDQARQTVSSEDRRRARETVRERENGWSNEHGIPLTFDRSQDTRRKRIRFENRIGFLTLSAKRITKEVNKEECASSRIDTHTGRQRCCLY